MWRAGSPFAPFFPFAAFFRLETARIRLVKMAEEETILLKGIRAVRTTFTSLISTVEKTEESAFKSLNPSTKIASLLRCPRSSSAGFQQLNLILRFPRLKHGAEDCGREQVVLLHVPKEVCVGADWTHNPRCRRCVHAVYVLLSAACHLFLFFFSEGAQYFHSSLPFALLTRTTRPLCFLAQDAQHFQYSLPFVFF